MPRVVFPPADVFDASAVSPQTRALNEKIVKLIETEPDKWTFEPAVMRARRRQGIGPFPRAKASERAETIEIDGPHGPIPLRIIAPDSPKGVFLHIHGGGWVLGAPDEQDPRFERFVDNCNIAIVSIDYRLAPEHPYPQPNDDCEAAALWLIRTAKERFGTDRLVIGGESAGAHLSVTTLLRLRDRHGIMPFLGANLVAGCYDLRLTPSAANWGTENLVLNTPDITNFVRCYIPADQPLTDPDVSPIFADLSGLPPALFTVGTRDALLDDSLFMAPRWAAAGNDTELAVFPGGAHVFIAFPGDLAEQGLTKIEAFLDTTFA